ncbi:MAG: small GTP-binding protein [Gammaproteobacteria bacterium]
MSTSKQSDSNLGSAINVGIVGHTNAGKTSLIRTLLRDDHFGNVDDSAGTTRSVEQTSIYADDEVVLNLFDTPGFEDSSALLIELDELSTSVKTNSPAELLKTIIDQKDRYVDFEQEIKVLRQSLKSDILLYIIDVREPLLGKYRDEVAILSKAGKPILPVFNFIAGNDQALDRWRDQMALFNLHAALKFDTVAFDFEAEKQLYQKLQSLMERHYDSLQHLIDYRQQVWLNLNQSAARRIFHLICEVACYRLEVTASQSKQSKTIGGNGSTDTKISSMHEFVRNAEQQALTDLLAIFSFTQLDIDLQQLPVSEGCWELDIFSPHMLKEFGLDIGASAISGAAVGAGVDLMVGGLSLGAASLLGAVIGGGWATAQRYQQEFKAAWRGHQWLCVDDNTVSLLYLRQCRLLSTLSHRGHAAQKKLKLFDNIEVTLPQKWNDLLKSLRQNPQWQQANPNDVEYQKLQKLMLDWLLGRAS